MNEGLARGGGGGGGHGGGGHGGGGGGHHGGGGHGGGGVHFRGRFAGPRFGPSWWWGPEVVVVQNETPVCVWRYIDALPAYVFPAFASTPRTILADGTAWTQVFTGNRWWAEHTAPDGTSAVFYECDFSGAGLAGLPDGEKAMTMQNGLGAVEPGLAAGAQAQQQQQLGPHTSPVRMLMTNGQLYVSSSWDNRVQNDVPATLVNVIFLSGDIDWLTVLRNNNDIRTGTWIFDGQGTIQNGRVDAIGTLRIGQKTNIGKFRIWAQLYAPSSQVASSASASRAGGPTRMMALHGLGAIHVGTPQGLRRTGLGSEVGLGIPGPWGDTPTGIAAGPYEITGTLVRLRTKAGTNQPEVDPGVTFNPVESSPNIIAGTPDQVDFAGSDGQNATASADGLTWAFVNVKTGPLAGKQGFVAMKFMGPVGWSAGHGGTGPAPSIQPQPGPSPTPNGGTTTSKSSAIPWIIGGVVLAGLVVGGAIATKKHRARRAGTHHPGTHHHAPAHAHEARRRRRRRR